MSSCSARIWRNSSRQLEGLSVLKIDPAFLFDLSTAMRGVATVETSTPVGYGAYVLDHARREIHQAIDYSIYAHLFRAPVRVAVVALLNQLDEMCKRVSNGETEGFLAI
jgi:hypothetical protein